MRTRTRILIFVGLLPVGVAVVLLAVGVVASFRPGPAVTVSFVRYAENGSVAILGITNGADSSIHCDVRHEVAERGTIVYSIDPTRALSLKGHTDGRTEVLGIEPSSRLYLFCRPYPSALRQRVDDLLWKVGLNIANPGFVVPVTLPPRDAQASPSNTAPARNALR